MILLVGVVAGLSAGAVVGLGARALLRAEVFTRTNFRGQPIATAGGLVVVLAFLVVEAGLRVLEAATDTVHAPPSTRLGALVMVLGFGLVGFLDDVVGSRAVTGFRGHLSALAGGELTTGSIKLIGGAAVAVVSVGVTTDAVADLLRGAVLVALAANLGNLLDLAPARTTKAATLVLVPLLAVASPPEELWWAAVVVGSAWMLAVRELQEVVMLGDTGANVVGAACGLALVHWGDGTTEWVALVVVVLLNALAELVSFSRVISAVAPLRLLDELGRRP